MNKSITHLHEALNDIFKQLDAVLLGLSDQAYSMPSKHLFNATIGQHVRHIIELFIELDKGYESGLVNYGQRARDHRIETDKNFAAQLLKEIVHSVSKADKQLLLEAGYNSNDSNSIQIQTNYYREFAYNIEHAIHHMALIRIGIKELSDVKLNEHFGIASATIKYQQSCAQ